MITTFRGYRPFGFMGGIGMVLCWIAAFLVLPPLALWLEARHPLGDASRPAWVDRFFARLGRATLRHSRPIAAVSAAATLACLVSMASIAHDPFENDTRKLQSSWASEPGGYGEVGDRVDRILKRIQTPAVILAGSEEDARTLERRYRELMRDGPPDLLLGSVFTAHTLVPPEQERKIEILGRIRKLLTPARLAKLDEKTQDLVRAWLPPEDLKPYGVTALPEVVRRQVREKDGTEGKLVLLYPRHGSDTADGRFIRRFAREIRSVPLTPGAWAAGSYLIFADMIESIQHDGPIATVAAFVGVFLLSLALARGERGGFLVPLSLVVGVIWTCGLGAASGMRINFLNFIALPITFGIGVDYAVNVYGRYRLGAADRATLVAAVANSGAAVAVASATTIIGYSSLLLSRNGALYSFGVLSVIGELACLTTALVLLPVMIGWRIPRR
jgi:predicted RND superfamily exporter protein